MKNFSEKKFKKAIDKRKFLRYNEITIMIMIIIIEYNDWSRTYVNT